MRKRYDTSLFSKLELVSVCSVLNQARLWQNPKLPPYMPQLGVWLWEFDGQRPLLFARCSLSWRRMVKGSVKQRFALIDWYQITHEIFCENLDEQVMQACKKTLGIMSCLCPCEWVVETLAPALRIPRFFFGFYWVLRGRDTYLSGTVMTPAKMKGNVLVYVLIFWKNWNDTALPLYVLLVDLDWRSSFIWIGLYVLTRNWKGMR